MVPADDPSNFRVSIRYGGRGGTRVELGGELDVASVGRLRRIFDAVLDDPDGVSVDLAPLRFIDLLGVRALLELGAVATGRGCCLDVSGASGQVARLLDLTRVRPRLAA